MLMACYLHDDFWLDILTRASRNVVDDGGAILQTGLEMHDNPSNGSLAVIRIYDQRAIHPSGESFFCSPGLLAGVLASRVSNNHDLIFESCFCMCNKKKMFL